MSQICTWARCVALHETSDLVQIKGRRGTSCPARTMYPWADVLITGLLAGFMRNIELTLNCAAAVFHSRPRIVRLLFSYDCEGRLASSTGSISVEVVVPSRADKVLHMTNGESLSFHFITRHPIFRKKCYQWRVWDCIKRNMTLRRS
jgi:hypothetical protein